MSDDDLDWLAVRIVMPGFDFDLLEGSPELRERLGAIGARLQRAGGGQSSGVV